MNKRQNKIVFCVLLICCSVGISSKAQIYQDHFGAGQYIGLKVTSSPPLWSNDAKATVIGSENLPDFAGASRFLAQAGFGGTKQEIEFITQKSIKAWLRNQLNMPYTSYTDVFNEVRNNVIDYLTTTYDCSVDTDVKPKTYLTYTFYQKLFTDDDILRQKMAFAFSQIFVVSLPPGDDPFFSSRGEAYAAYYDILYKHAFGNFRDLLHDVALNPIMGRYLSHYQNKKANTGTGTQPDENFAREIMQLFSIGLIELNNDGTPKLDENCQPIPTYDIEDVQEMAKVFTGLSIGGWDTIRNPDKTGVPITFNGDKKVVDWTKPMAMFEEYHETSQKILPDGTTLQDGGMQDVNDAIDWLFNHPNVGPFISIRLIQQFVKSNPTPIYVNRIATVFNDNGNGVRGDLKAVIEAILIDPEARNCEWINDPRGGKLLQPLERYLNLFNALEIVTPSNNYLFNDIYELIHLQQAYLWSPTVFNFFTPFYAEGKHVAPENMVSPEFQILNSVTAINYLNRIRLSLIDLGGSLYKNYTEGEKKENGSCGRLANDADKPVLNFQDHIATYQSYGLSSLIDELDLLLCRGQLHPEVKTHIENNINDNLDNDPNYDAETIVQDVLYFIMASPSYAILK